MVFLLSQAVQGKVLGSDGIFTDFAQVESIGAQGVGPNPPVLSPACQGQRGVATGLHQQVMRHAFASSKVFRTGRDPDSAASRDMLLDQGSGPRIESPGLSVGFLKVKHACWGLG